MMALSPHVYYAVIYTSHIHIWTLRSIILSKKRKDVPLVSAAPLWGLESILNVNPQASTPRALSQYRLQTSQVPSRDVANPRKFLQTRLSTFSKLRARPWDVFCGDFKSVWGFRVALAHNSSSKMWESLTSVVFFSGEPLGKEEEECSASGMETRICISTRVDNDRADCSQGEVCKRNYREG